MNVEVLTAKCLDCGWGTSVDMTNWRPKREEEPPFDSELPYEPDSPYD